MCVPSLSLIGNELALSRIAIRTRLKNLFNRLVKVNSFITISIFRLTISLPEGFN
jgi:hypothetical protein